MNDIETTETVASEINAHANAGMNAGANIGAVAMETTYHCVSRNAVGEINWEETCTNRVVTAGLNKLLDATFKTGLTTPLWYILLVAPSVSDGVMATASPNLSSASALFTAADVGRAIIVRGALLGGFDLVTTILSFTDTSHVVLSANCTVAAGITAAQVLWDSRAADTMASHSPWTETAAYSEAVRQTFTPGTIASGSVDNSASAATFTCNAANTLIAGMALCDNNTKSGTTGTLYGMAPFTGSMRLQQSTDTLTVTVTVNAIAQ